MVHKRFENRRSGKFYKSIGKDVIQYIGIAIDETVRVERHKDKPGILLPLVEVGWTEADCKQWCIDNDLLSPIYSTSMRGGVGSVITRALINCDCLGETTLICGRF